MLNNILLYPASITTFGVGFNWPGVKSGPASLWGRPQDLVLVDRRHQGSQVPLRWTRQPPANSCSRQHSRTLAGRGCHSSGESGDVKAVIRTLPVAGNAAGACATPRLIYGSGSKDEVEGQENPLPSLQSADGDKGRPQGHIHMGLRGGPLEVPLSLKGAILDAGHGECGTGQKAFKRAGVPVGMDCAFIWHGLGATLQMIFPDRTTGLVQPHAPIQPLEAGSLTSGYVVRNAPKLKSKSHTPDTPVVNAAGNNR